MEKNKVMTMETVQNLGTLFNGLRPAILVGGLDHWTGDNLPSWEDVDVWYMFINHYAPVMTAGDYEKHGENGKFIPRLLELCGEMGAYVFYDYLIECVGLKNAHAFSLHMLEEYPAGGDAE